MGRLSIKQRLAKAKPKKRRVGIAASWAAKWEAEQRAALRVNDLERLRELTGKRFAGLQSVLQALSQPNEDKGCMITIENDGQDIASTNYWSLEHAHRGLLYLSANAGAWRLLVPKGAEHHLPEIRTGKTAIIEPSIHMLGQCWDVVFEDGSDSPFSLAIDKRQTDRAMQDGDCVLAVWTEAGKVLELPCQIKTA